MGFYFGGEDEEEMVRCFSSDCLGDGFHCLGFAYFWNSQNSFSLKC
tara:strand:- start:249 stop:386 length:138 start_codon:yes stop_codon:yes gene_type:complete